jgi:hypothetical protein
MRHNIITGKMSASNNVDKYGKALRKMQIKAPMARQTRGDQEFTGITELGNLLLNSQEHFELKRRLMTVA